MISRRNALKGVLLALASGRSNFSSASSSEIETTHNTGTYNCFVPGYYPGSARYQGQSILDDERWRSHVPAGYEGPLSILTRVTGEGESLKRALYPVQGHGLCLHPDTRTGFFAANKHANNQMVAFDTTTLEPVEFVPVHRKGWFGGGHALYTQDGAHLLVPERAPNLPFSGSVEQHFGAITVRDARNYKVLAEFSCHGIAPHEIALTADGHHLVVANYGSTRPRGVGTTQSLPEIIEPCLTILELGSGRLVEKVFAPDTGNEIRHLTAVDLQRVFAIQTRLGDDKDYIQMMGSSNRVHERDITAEKDRAYLPAQPLHVVNKNEHLAVEVKGVEPLLARHGLSIIYEPKYDEILATFPSSHSLMVFDASTGHLKHLLKTDNLGLRHPCGLALHPDGQHYIVTGYWRNLYLFKRGDHSLNREACLYMTSFGHSHIAVQKDLISST